MIKEALIKKLEGDVAVAEAKDKLEAITNL